MEESGLVLTAAEKAILKSYCSFCDGLSEYMGDGYEIVLHDLSDYEHSAIKVINGYHTGRKEGAPITDLALFMLEKIRRQNGSGAYSPYFSTNKHGEPLRSTTIPIFGENGRIIGLMCINFYMNTPLFNVLKSMSPDSAIGSMPASPSPQKENYVDNVSEMISSAVEQAQDEVRKSPGITATNRNKEIVALLNERGIFNIKNAIQETAAILGVSKNTIYMHLRNLSRRAAQNEQ